MLRLFNGNCFHLKNSMCFEYYLFSLIFSTYLTIMFLFCYNSIIIYRPIDYGRIIKDVI